MASKHNKTEINKTRVEFTHSFDGSQKVIAFVEYTPVGISFGTPRISPISQPLLGGSASDNFQRITIHLDGRVKFHAVDAPTWNTPVDRNVERLSDWSEFKVYRTEQSWAHSTAHFPKAKSGAKNTRTISLDVAPDTNGIVAVFCLSPKNELSDEDKEVLHSMLPEAFHDQFSTWVFEAGFPYMTVSLSGLKDSPKLDVITDVGKQYE